MTREQYIDALESSVAELVVALRAEEWGEALDAMSRIRTVIRHLDGDVQDMLLASVEKEL